jgi:hypothetical protein
MRLLRARVLRRCAFVEVRNVGSASYASELLSKQGLMRKLYCVNKQVLGPLRTDGRRFVREWPTYRRRGTGSVVCGRSLASPPGIAAMSAQGQARHCRQWHCAAYVRCCSRATVNHRNLPRFNTSPGPARSLIMLPCEDRSDWWIKAGDTAFRT